MTAEAWGLATLEMGSLDSVLKIIHQASEIGKALDDYQYLMCLMLQNLDKGTKNYERILMSRAAAITLITTFRMTITASSSDVVHFEEDLRELIAKMKALAKTMERRLAPSEESQTVKSTRHERAKRRSRSWSSYGAYVTQKRATVVRTKKTNPVDAAFEFAGLEPTEVKKRLLSESDEWRS